MAFDGMIVAAAAKELSSCLAGGKIEKIYQPEPDELILHIRAPASSHVLHVSSGGGHARFHLLSEAPENPPAPPAFCMLLRKHLCGGRITGIMQHDSERILEISVATSNELAVPVGKALVFEIMGKHSNVILLDTGSGRIVDSIKRVSSGESRVRQVLPGKAYEYPPDQGKTPFWSIGEDEIESLCQCPPDALAKSLLDGIQGISPAMAARLASAAGECSPADGVHSEIVSMRAALESGCFTPFIYLDSNNAPLDFHIFPIPELEAACGKAEFESLSLCIERYYQDRVGLNRMRQKTSDLEKSVKAGLDKLRLKKQRMSEDIMAAERMEVFRLYGELLMANLHLAAQGDEEVKVTSYYDGRELTIPLDKRFTPAKNAQGYFKKYGKAKTAVREKTARLADADADIRYLESVHSFIENAAAPEDLDAIRDELIDEGYLRRRKRQPQRRKTRPSPYRYITGGGLSVMAGKNNAENDALTFRTASRSDVWLHTKDIPGSHVILFTDGGEPPEGDLLEAASIAAYHSKGKGSENVPVDYTLVKHVKKPSGAKPGMVIFTNNRTVFVSPALPNSQFPE